MSDFDRKRRKSDGPEHPLIVELSDYVYNNWKNLPDYNEWILSDRYTFKDLHESYMAWIERYEAYSHKPWVSDIERKKYEDLVDEEEEVVSLPHVRRSLLSYYYPSIDKESMKTFSPEFLTENNLW